MAESLFHAYVHVHADGTYEVTFVSQDSCDRWWRALQDQKHNQSGDGPHWDIKRLSPQAYIIGARVFALYQTEMGIQLGGPISVMNPDIRHNHTHRILPPPSRVDHLNRKAYYIRPRTRPNLFWHVNKSLDRTVDISDSPSPTKFIIQRANPLPYDPAPKDDILIDSDEVIMMVVLTPSIRESITLGGAGNLQPSSTGSAFIFKFGLLTTGGGFMIWPGTPKICFSDAGLGDEWELVV